MAYFDSAFFDSGARFDEIPGPTHQNKRHMNKFNLGLKNKTVAQKLALGTAHITAMTSNAHYPVATRVPADAAFATLQDALQAAADAADAAEVTWKAANVARDDAEEAWDQGITARANNCEAVTPNDPAKLATTALPLRNPPAPIGDLPAPENLRAEMGDQQGEIDLVWNSVYGASSFVIEFKEDGTAQPWMQISTQQQTKHTATGLVSGKTYAFRVRALGPNGLGPWSDVAVKMAP